MSYSETALEEKLRRLNTSAQSVQTLSHWIVFHRKHHAQSVAVWARELRSACSGSGSSNGRAVAFLYLLNDIAQTSRKRGDDFVRAFSPVLVDSCALIASRGGPDARDAVLRTLRVWEERSVFPAQLLASVRAKIAPPAPAPAPAAVVGGSLGEAVRREQAATAALDSACAKAAAVRDALFTGALLPGVASKAEMTELAYEFEDAIALLEAQQAAAAEALSARDALAKALAEMAQAVEARRAQGAEAAQRAAGLLASVDAMKFTMKAIYEQLPQERPAVPAPMTMLPQLQLQQQQPMVAAAMPMVLPPPPPPPTAAADLPLPPQAKRHHVAVEPVPPDVEPPSPPSAYAELTSTTTAHHV